MPGEPLLGEAHIAELPHAEAAAWNAYLIASVAGAAADRARIDAELVVADRSAWTPAPAGPDFVLSATMTPAYFMTPAAKQLADSIVLHQTPCGGWSKAVDFSARPRLPGESYGSQASWSWVATFDNGAITEQLCFVANVIAAQGDPAPGRVPSWPGLHPGRPVPERLLAAELPAGRLLPRCRHLQ